MSTPLLLKIRVEYNWWGIFLYAVLYRHTDSSREIVNEYKSSLCRTTQCFLASHTQNVPCVYPQGFLHRVKDDDPSKYSVLYYTLCTNANKMIIPKFTCRKEEIHNMLHLHNYNIYTNPNMKVGIERGGLRRCPQSQVRQRLPSCSIPTTILPVLSCKLA